MPVTLADIAQSDRYCTPDEVLAPVRAFAPIDLDPCGHPASMVQPRREYLLERGEDGLELPWRTDGGIAYINPPYGRGWIPLWLGKIQEEHRRGAACLSLLPADTSTRWCQQLLAEAPALCFWRRRVRFVGAKDAAKFPSLVPYFGRDLERFAHHFAPHGRVLLRPWRSSDLRRLA